MLLRPGGIGRAAIEAALGERVYDRDGDAPRASGTLASHYAPRTSLALADAASVAASPDAAVLAFGERPPAHAGPWIRAPREAAAYGHDLYANLRALDAGGAPRILVEVPPRAPEWEAVNDRLARAAAGAASEAP